MHFMRCQRKDQKGWRRPREDLKNFNSFFFSSGMSHLYSSLQFRLLFRGRYQSLELHARITLFVLQYKIQILILVLFGRQQSVPALTTTLCIGNSAEICSKINAMSLLLVLHCEQMLFKMKMKLNQSHRTCKFILSVQIK